MRQVEGLDGRSRGQGIERIFVGLDQLDARTSLARVEHALIRHAVVLGEDRAQDLVAFDHVGGGSFHGREIGHARQAHRERNVVGAVGRVELAEEPQTALRERQRHELGARAAAQRGLGALGLGDQLGEAGDVGHFEHGSQRQLDLEGRAHLRDDAGHHQRVAAEFEEVAVDIDRGQAQRFSEQRAQDLFGRVARAALVAAGLAVFGRGQRAAVELAAGHQRQLVDGHDRGGQHVVGQRERHELAQLAGVDHGVGVTYTLGHHIAHQTLVARAVFTHDHGGLSDGRVRDERGVDLTQLDAEAADLHLHVGAAEVVHHQRAICIGLPARQVTGAVHAAASGAERVGNETLGCQAGAVEIAARHAVAGNVELARHTHRHGLQARVEDVELSVQDRAADRRALLVGGLGGLLVAGERAIALLTLQREAGGPHGGLGRAVEVDDVPCDFAHRTGQRCGQRFAADQHAQAAQHVGVAAGERFPERRRGLHDRGARCDDQACQGRRVAHDAARRDHHAGTADERQVELKPGDVEADGGDGQQAVAAVERDRTLHRNEEVAQRVVRDDHALGLASRARGVDHVGRALRAHRAHALGVGRVGGAARRDAGVGDQERLALGGFGQAVGDVGRGQHDRGHGVFDHRGQALGGQIGVERQVGRARLHHAQQAGDEIGGARQGHADDVVRADAAADQLARNAVGLRVERGVEHRVGFEHGGGCIRRARHLCFEHRRQQRLGDGLRGLVGVLQQLLALGVVEQVDLADGRVRVGNDGFDQADQAGLVAGQFFLRVEVGVGVEVHPHAFAHATVVDEHRQVFDRPVGEVERRGVGFAQAQVVVEGLDVHDGGEQVAAFAQQVEVAAQVFVAIALVAQRFAHAAADLLEHVGDRQIGPHGQAERHRVGQHGRDAAQLLVGARRHGQTQHQVVGAGHAIEVDADGGDHQLREAATQGLGGFARGQHQRFGRAAGLAQDAAHLQRLPFGQADGRGAVGEEFGPVLALAGEVFGRAIGVVFVDEVGQRAEGAQLDRAFAHRRVGLGNAARQQAAGKAVDQDVVGAVVPVVARGRGPDEAGGPEAVFDRVVRRGVFGLRPFHESGVRIGPVAEVDQGQDAADFRVDGLHRAAFDLDEAQTRSGGFDGGLVHGRVEAVDVDLAVDDQHFGQVEHGVRCAEPLRKPHAALGNGEREVGVLLSRGWRESVFVMHGRGPDRLIRCLQNQRWCPTWCSLGSAHAALRKLAGRRSVQLSST